MIKFCAPCLFGLEGLVAEELRRLGAREVLAENGRVNFSGDEADIATMNIGLRCAERVLIELGRFPADSFDQLFEGTRALHWERFIPSGGAFPVRGHSLNSTLQSIPACQKIIKKAVARRLGEKYQLSWLPEDKGQYQIQFSIMKDQARLFLDTSGAGLHKRGYRPQSVEAPLRETLAAAIVTLTRYRGREDFADPFCGSGTIPIEAALVAKNRAPGLGRGFAAESWPDLGQDIWRAAREAARAREFQGEYRISGSDLDPRALELAEQNAARAGVSELIRFKTADALSFSPDASRGIVATNPPYGERLLDREAAQKIYRGFGGAVRRLEGWRAYILSSHPEFETHYGQKARKKRKLYNGMIKCDLYMYHGAAANS